VIVILVVDDDGRIRSVTEMVLRRAGYDVVSAAGPGEAMELVRSRADIQVALIDIVLPMMTGFDLAAEIRRAAPSIKIVFMSGFRSDQFQQPVREPVVSKPFTADVLTGAIASVLEI
jgi:CheY-like chemotaxis protein